MSKFFRRDTRKVAVVGSLVKEALMNVEMKDSMKSLRLAHKRSDSGLTAPLSSSDEEKELCDLVLSFSDMSDDTASASSDSSSDNDSIAGDQVVEAKPSVPQKRTRRRRVEEPTAFDFLMFSDSEDEDDEPETSRSNSVGKILSNSDADNKRPTQDVERNSRKAEKNTEEPLRDNKRPTQGSNSRQAEKITEEPLRDNKRPTQDIRSNSRQVEKITEEPLRDNKRPTQDIRSNSRQVEKITEEPLRDNKRPTQDIRSNSRQAEKITEEPLRDVGSSRPSRIPRGAHYRAKSEIVPMEKSTHRRTKSLGREITRDMETIHEVDEADAKPRQRASSEVVVNRKYFSKVPLHRRNQSSEPSSGGTKPSSGGVKSRRPPRSPPKPVQKAWLGGAVDGNMLEQDLKNMNLEAEQSAHPLLSSKPSPMPKSTALEPNLQSSQAEKTTIDGVLSSKPAPILKNGHHRSRSAMPETQTIVPVTKTTHRRTKSLGREITWDMETIDETNELPRQRASSEAVSSRKYFSGSSRQQRSSEPSKSDTNDLDALKRKLESRKRQHGPHDPKVGEIHNLIGNVHFRCRHYEQAIEAYKETLQCDKGAQSPTDCAPIAAALGNIGTAYWTMGDLVKSLEYLEHALRAHIFLEQSQGKDPKASLEVAGCMYQIGLAECLRKDYKSALQNLTLCCKIQVTVLGESNVDVARTLDAIGRAHLGLGDYEQAMSNHHEALVMKRRCASPDSTDTSGIFVSMRNIAAVHQARNEYDEAISLYLEVSSVQKSQLARLKREPGYNKPAAVRLAMEAGETLVTLKELYEIKGDLIESTKKGREAVLYFKEGGMNENDKRMSSCISRGSGIWNSV